jgi:hypothetical protein
MGGGVGFVIHDLYAFVAVHSDGDEGIIGIGDPMLPMIAADLTRLQRLRPYAQQVADASGLTVRLVRFTTRTELDVIAPTEGED